MSASLSTVQPEDVLDFWRAAGPRRWFRKDESFDSDFRASFLGAHEAARRGELGDWTGHADGALALLILLDQFPRNCFRSTARMFECDAQARDLARDAISKGFDQRVDEPLRNFFYLPFMHSEDLADQNLAVELARPLGGEALRYAVMHRDIIEKFGRFPHRNAILGRTTSPAEQNFLDSGGFAG